MPSTAKKKIPSGEEDKRPTKKFVVEEKDSQADTKTETVSIKQPETESAPKSIPEVKIDTPIENEKPSPEVLKTDNENDTLSSSGITSFSLLDNKGTDPAIKNMTENVSEKPSVENISTDNLPATGEKSSTEEVNKWIENYDDKDISSDKKKKPGFFKTFLILLIVLSVIAAIAGGVIYYQKNVAEKSPDETQNNENITQEEPSPSPTEAPVTEEVKPDYTEYSLQILNGSGVPGEAGKVKDLLSEYEFHSIITGNASSYDFDKTIISVKDGLPKQVFDDLKEAIEESYEVESSSEKLEESSDFDVVITVGAKK